MVEERLSAKSPRVISAKGTIQAIILRPKIIPHINAMAPIGLKLGIFKNTRTDTRAISINTRAIKSVFFISKALYLQINNL